MAETATHKLKNKDVVAVISNMLKLVIFDNTRDNAKRIFKDAASGKTLKLPPLKMQDETEVPLRLQLEAKNFQGNLSFSHFRNHLRALLNRVMMQGQQGDIPMWVSQDGSRRMVNIPVVHDAQGVVNALAMGFTSSKQGIVINLLFLDPKDLEATPESQGSVA